VLFGGNGNDVLIGGGGINVINGGDGQDIAVFSGVFEDYIFSTVGATQTGATIFQIIDVRGVDGANFVSDVETLQIAEEAIEVSLGLVTVNVTGTNDADTFIGDIGNDTIEGSLGNDTISGGDGDDILFGDIAAGRASLPTEVPIFTILGEVESPDMLVTSVERVAFSVLAV